MPTLPPIKNESKRKLVSYATQPVKSYTDQEINPMLNGAKTDFDLTLEPNEIQKLTGNVMVDTSETNVINLSIDNTQNQQNLELKVSYNTIDDCSNASAVYLTSAEKLNHFYQTYPTRNRYVMIEADGSNLTSNIGFTGSLRLSKYTQFNTSSQLRDVTNRNTLALNERSLNDYYEDVIRNKIKDVQFNTASGHFFELPQVSGVHIVGSGNQTVPNLWTTRTDEKIFLKSDTIDTNSIGITGISSNGSFHVETINLNSTSNSAPSIHSYLCVNSMVGTSAGNVSANSSDSGQLLNYLESGNYYSNQAFYGNTIHQTSYLKRLHYTANIDDRGAILRLKIKDGLGSPRTVYEQKINDEQINIDLEQFRILLEPINIVYVEIQHEGRLANRINKCNVKLDLVSHSNVLDPI
tara:strand:- start:282 stop:1508 length:1227 start_codon:yes stop_codon:yes gene_type:complete